ALVGEVCGHLLAERLNPNDRQIGIDGSDGAADGIGIEAAARRGDDHDVVIVTAPGARFDADAVRRAIASVDPNLPVSEIQTLREQVAANFSNQRLLAQLTSLFGILALALASIGLYGVTAFTTASRTAEIGIRLALGARRASVLGLILRGALSLVGLGLVAGFGLSLAAARLLGSQFSGVNPSDPAVLAVAVLALGSAGFAAAFIPALRASSIAPIEALRSE
ncbi:MAG TPA: FtsX-like permease family protein, partial [Bryobacteraceae bacterium]|nr:FtsX-like permease family protein [Bryobacteraceae bacterium]